MLVSVRDQTGSEICAGAVGGRELLSKLLALTAREPLLPEPVVLDFEGVDVATASFLREGVLGFRDMVRSRRSTLYPVVANMNHVIVEELEDILHARGGAIIAGDCDRKGNLIGTRLLGQLEPKQQRIFDLVAARRELDAGQLQREFGDAEGIKQTAWNNRLAALSGAGLVIEMSEGRSKRYRPIFEGN